MPTIIACPKCGYALGYATDSKLTLVGAKTPITSKATIECIICAHRKPWRPVRVRESLKPKGKR